MTRNFTFSGHFWEHPSNNGVLTLVNRMRMGKQTCESLKAAFEIRVASEQQYADNLLRMAAQLESCEETGQLAHVLKTTQIEWTSLANTRLQSAQDLNTKVIQPLSTLLSKQKQLRRELQANMTKLYNNRQLQTHCVLRARDRYNAECTKANEIMQQSSGKEKHSSYKRASAVIKKYQQAYDDAMADLEVVTEEWNKQWQHTCQEFEQLEEERLGFVQSNIYHGNDLCLATSYASVEAYEKIEAAVDGMDVDADLDDFVQKKGNSDTMPGTMDYIKMFVLQEQNKSEQDDDQETNDPVDVDPGHSQLEDDKETPADDNVSSLMVGRLEIYNSDDDTDSENSDYDYDDVDQTDQSQQSLQNEDPDEYLETADSYRHYEEPLAQQNGDLHDSSMTLEEDAHHFDEIYADSQGDTTAHDLYDTLTTQQESIKDRGDRIDNDDIGHHTGNDAVYDSATEQETRTPYFEQTHAPLDRSAQPPPPPPIHDYIPEPPSSYKVNEELESMLKQLEQQTTQHASVRTSKPYTGRARLSGVRPRTPKPKPGQTLLKELAGIASDTPSTIVAGSDAPMDFFDPFSSLASTAQTEDQQKWRLQEVTRALQHNNPPKRRPLPERPD